MIIAEQLNIFNKDNDIKNDTKNDINKIDIFNINYKIEIIEETEKDSSDLLFYKGE